MRSSVVVVQGPKLNPIGKGQNNKVSFVIIYFVAAAAIVIVVFVVDIIVRMS